MQTYYRLAFQAAFRPGVDIGSRRDSMDINARPEDTIAIAPLVGPGACGAPLDVASKAMARAAVMWLRAGEDTLRHPGAARARKALSEASESEKAPWTLVLATTDDQSAAAVASLLEGCKEKLVLEGDDEREYMMEMKKWH